MVRIVQEMAFDTPEQAATEWALLCLRTYDCYLCPFRALCLQLGEALEVGTLPYNGTIQHVSNDVLAAFIRDRYTC